MLEERRPDRGDESRRQAGSGTQGHNGDTAPAQPGGGPPAETAAQILRHGGSLRGGRAAARAGLTAAVILAVAIAAGVAGLSLLANTGDGHHGSAAQMRANGTAARRLPGVPLRVVSVQPSNKSSQVSGGTRVQIAFSAPLASGSVLPSFHPAVAGEWQASGSVLSFTPSVAFAPSTRYTLRLPAGTAGLRSAGGGLLAKPILISFRTGRLRTSRIRAHRRR